MKNLQANMQINIKPQLPNIPMLKQLNKKIYLNQVYNVNVCMQIMHMHKYMLIDKYKHTEWERLNLSIKA